MGTTSDPGTPGEADDPRAALAALARDLRARLGWHRRGGSWSVAGGASPRGEASAAVAHAIDGDGEAVRALEAPAAHARRVADAANAPVAPFDIDGPPLIADVDEPAARRTLAAIRAELGDCQRCKLCSTRKNIVFGIGPEPAALMFIGEAPGADEDRLGDPFVGKAGELLDRMIEAMGWARSQVYIANVLKCRPPNNRNPEPDEVAACRPFLDAQIQAVRPRVIVTLGRPAANCVLGKDAPISALRGRFFEHRGVRVMPTYHPAYLLREPSKKRDTWDDLKQVIAELERLGVPAPRPPKG